MNNAYQMNSTDEVALWIARRNREVVVDVQEVPFAELRGWRFDKVGGNLVHESGKFFSIVGLDVYTNHDNVRRWTQPVINQPEVGYLGIVCHKFNGVMHYLLQAKIEPGNVNCVQLSPTLQATRSNYMQVHGGKKPAFLEYFQGARPDQIVLDQLQSEQGARFYRKRNRNMVIRIEGSEGERLVAEAAENPDFRWLTLPQIKDLLRRDNTVNMDTRTVLSGLRLGDEGGLNDPRAVMSIDEILHRLTELKSRYELVVDKIGLRDVQGWYVSDTEIARQDKKYFRVLGVKVTISNREVASWCQPLVQPMQEGLCVLFCKKINGLMHYLFQAKIECGNFDVVELAPTIQCLTGDYRMVAEENRPRFVTEFLSGAISGKVIVDAKQSEEGGRFYHEQNRNVVFELADDQEIEEHSDFLWLTMAQIKEFLRFNNYLNIQVRSLISAL